MNEPGQLEQLPKSGVPDFESKLFQKGTLDFNFGRYVAESGKNLERSRRWYQRTDWDSIQTEEELVREFESIEHEMIWRNRFSGQIPSHWHTWYNVQSDFEKARELGIQLNKTLVDAGVLHPHPLVANEVGRGQKLETRQLTWLLVRPDFSESNRDEILSTQRRLGVSEKDLQRAMKIADLVRNKARQLRREAWQVNQ